MTKRRKIIKTFGKAKSIEVQIKKKEKVKAGKSKKQRRWHSQKILKNGKKFMMILK